jgi:hypothetical protein
MSDAYEEETGPQFDSQVTPAEGESGDDELLERFAKWQVALDGHWSKWREDTRLAYGFAAGEQWTDEERAQMEGAEKIAVTFNLVDPVLSAVQGAEIQNRQQVQFYPREVGDTGVSDVLTQAADFVSDECNGDQEDSEAFWDTLICGLGWTESRPEIEGDQVMLVKERVDPLQMWADPSARKRCLEDRRYVKREIPMSADEFEDWKAEIHRDDLEPGELNGPDDRGKRVTIVNPAVRYTHGMLGSDPSDDAVIVCEWQWWDREPVTLAGVPDPTTGVVKIQPVDAKTLAAMRQADPQMRTSQSHRKVYYRAFATDTEVLFKEELREGCFRYEPITGKRDRNSGTWFGLVKPMMDPQRFTNKLYSEILHIVRTNANGGMALEEDAVEDVRQFESTWASTDKITWLKPGALSGAHGQKMLPKQAPPVQVALFQLMEFARDMVKATTGVNEEILGLVQREQAGVLEAQRKQAAYGILSAFFDAKRRYQRNQGRLLLGQMNAYFPPDKLVRIVDKGTAQYVPMAMALDAQTYDIVVDEAPAGPDQKAKVLAVLMPLIPQLMEGGLIGPEALAEIIPYLPIPASVANKLAKAIADKAKASGPDPLAQAMGQAELQNKQADTGKKVADTGLAKAKAFKEITDAHAGHLQMLSAGDALAGPPVPPSAPGPPGGMPGQPGAPGGGAGGAPLGSMAAPDQSLGGAMGGEPQGGPAATPGQSDTETGISQ